MVNKGIETGEVSEPFYENVQNPQDLAAVKEALLKAGIPSKYNKYSVTRVKGNIAITFGTSGVVLSLWEKNPATEKKEYSIQKGKLTITPDGVKSLGNQFVGKIDSVLRISHLEMDELQSELPNLEKITPLSA